MVMAKPKQFVMAVKTVVTWICASCKKANKTKVDDNLRVDGGCQGHGPDKYCYCSSIEVICDTECSVCGIATQLCLMR